MLQILLILYMLSFATSSFQVCAIEEMLPSKRQNLMFSATIPTWVGRIAKAMMKEPLSVTVGEVSVRRKVC